MARVCLLLLSLQLSFHPALLHQLKRFPEAGSVYGVFEVSQLQRGQPVYSFAALAARAVCLRLGGTMASRAQVELALRHGLQTCRFGWVDEQIAIVPRLEASPICGQNNTGLVTWRAPVSKLFDVFCFNETDYELQLLATTTLGPTLSPSTPSSSSSPPHSSSSSTSPSANQVEKALKSTQTAAGEVPTVLVITAMFVLLLLGVLSMWYIRKKGSCYPLLAEGVHCKPNDTELQESCVVHITSTQQPSNTPATSTQQPSDTPATSTQQPSDTPATSTQQPSDTPATSTQQPSDTPATSTQQPSDTPATSTQQPSDAPQEGSTK